MIACVKLESATWSWTQPLASEASVLPHIHLLSINKMLSHQAYSSSQKLEVLEYAVDAVPK